MCLNVFAVSRESLNTTLIICDFFITEQISLLKIAQKRVPLCAFKPHPFLISNVFRVLQYSNIKEVVA